MSVPTEVYVILGISIIHVFERLIYYGCMLALHFSKSSCVTSVANGCLKAEAEIETTTNHQLEGEVEKTVKENL